MKKKDSPISWRPAEILSGNGNIRHYPPPLEGMDNAKTGQVVEVLDGCSWRTATIVKVLKKDCYLVRVNGCLQELSVQRSNTRARQSCLDEKWNLIGKGSGTCVKPYQLSVKKPSKKRSKVLRLTTEKYTKLQSHVNHSALVKRGSNYGLCKQEASTNIREVNAADRVYKRQRVMPSALDGKTDVTISTESNDSDSDACSVGSCSINNECPNKFSNILAEGHRQETDLLGSDAESCESSADKEESCCPSSAEKVAASIHRLELHAYRCTLEALYACGPLSWEQEALLTNLRITLHISNDEQLTELRTLISAGNGIRIS